MQRSVKECVGVSINLYYYSTHCNTRRKEIGLSAFSVASVANLSSSDFGGKLNYRETNIIWGVWFVANCSTSLVLSNFVDDLSLHASAGMKSCLSNFSKLRCGPFLFLAA